MLKVRIGFRVCVRARFCLLQCIPCKVKSKTSIGYCVYTVSVIFETSYNSTRVSGEVHLQMPHDSNWVRSLSGHLDF